MMATSKAKRSAAARKAARTRKRNAAAKAKSKKKPASVRRASRKTGRDLQEEIANFLKYRLEKSIIRDVKDFQISSEADLRSSVTYHIRNFLYKMGRDDLRLHTGLWTYPSKKAVKRLKEIGRKGGSKIEIDVAISKLSFENAPSRVIGIELKEREKDPSDDYVTSDVKKLSILREDGMIKYGFVIYLYKEGPEADEKRKVMVKKIPKKHKKRIFVMAINATEQIRNIRVKEFSNRYEQTRWLKREKMPELTAVDTRKKRKGKNGKRKSR